MKERTHPPMSCFELEMERLGDELVMAIRKQQVEQPELYQSSRHEHLKRIEALQQNQTKSKP